MRQHINFSSQAEIENDNHDSKRKKEWSREENLVLLEVMGKYYRSLHHSNSANEKGLIWARIYEEFSARCRGRSSKALRKRYD